MALSQSSERSLRLRRARNGMREKKKGALRSAKLNASLVSKIKAKVINNSFIKVSLKNNNKALAQALNEEKANVQQLNEEKAILQKEVEHCHFQNAVLRHKLSFLTNILKEFENLIASVKAARLSEFHTSSPLLSSGQKSSTSEDSWDNYVVDRQLLSAPWMPMRVPISKVRDAVEQGGSSAVVQTSSLYRQRPASNECPEAVPVASKDILPPQPAEKPQSHEEENGKKLNEAVESQEGLPESHIVGEALCATQQNPNVLPALDSASPPLSYEDNEVAKQFPDGLSDHFTVSRKHSILSATSTPSSNVDVLPCVSSTQAAQWSITKDSSSFSKSNTQPQLKSPSYLVSPTQATGTLDRISLGEEVFCDQPQTTETGCDVEMDPSYSRVPEFVPVKVKSGGNCKTGEKITVKKASTGMKKTNAIENSAESSPVIPQDEETAQNAEKLLQPKVAMCSSESEVSEMSQKACVGAFSGKNRGFGLEQHCCSPDEVRDLRRTYVVNPAQLHGLGSGDLLQQVKDEAVFKIQSMESLPKSPICTFSSHEIPSDDSSLQNSLFLRKETSSACALQKDSIVSKTSIRQKTNRKTRVIRQSDYSEKNLPNGVKIPEAIAEEQPERSKTIRKTVRKSSSGDQRNEVDGFGPCIDVQDVIKESTKDLPGNLKCSRRTYVICPLDLAGNLGSAQTDFERGEIVPPRSIPGSKGSKIPRNQKLVGAQSNKKQSRGVQENGQTKAGNKVNVSEKEVYPKPKPQRKRKSSAPPETDTLARQIGAKVHIGSSSELASQQTLPKGKSSCITDGLPEQDVFLKEQVAEISHTNNLVDLSHSLKCSSVTCSAVSPVSSRITDVLVSRRLSSEDKMPKKSSVWPGSSLAFKEKAAEEIPEERNQLKSSSWSLPSQKPAIRPLQDLTNARTLCPSSSEETSEGSSRRRRAPVCYAEPKLNSKLRRGDPFTDTQFLHPPLRKTKKNTLKAEEITGKIKKEKERLLELCPIVGFPGLAEGRDIKL